MKKRKTVCINHKNSCTIKTILRTLICIIIVVNYANYRQVEQKRNLLKLLLYFLVEVNKTKTAIEIGKYS